MKRNKVMITALLAGALLVGTVFALEAGDTLITQTYLLKTLFPQMEEQVEAHTKDYMDGGYAAGQEALDAAQTQLNAQLKGSGAEGAESATIRSMDYGQGDVLTLSEGATIVVSKGRAMLEHDGVVIDSTTGNEIPSGTATETAHRYIVAENTTLKVTVYSGLATLGYNGIYGYTAGTGKNHPFFDVSLNDANNEAITYVYQRGLFGGDGINFNADDVMQRAMVMTVLYALMDRPQDQMAEALALPNPFTDVAEDRWYNHYVRWGFNESVAGGYGDGKFQPTKSVSIPEMLQFLYAFGNKNMGLTLEGTYDVSTLSGGDSLPKWSLNAVQWAASTGVWTGDFSSEPATRGDIATMLYQFSKIYGDQW